MFMNNYLSRQTLRFFKVLIKGEHLANAFQVWGCQSWLVVRADRLWPDQRSLADAFELRDLLFRRVSYSLEFERLNDGEQRTSGND
jgi:hypothetical protein